MSDELSQKERDLKQLHDEANKVKADLSDGADVSVPKGDEAAPPERVNPHDARKALFKRHREVRDADIKQQVEQIGDNEALITGNRQNEVRGEQKPVIKEQQEKGLDTGNERVTVKIEGREYRVPKRDVDRAGGLEAYQKRRAASIALTRAAEYEKAAKAKLEEAERMAAEAAARVAKLSDAPPQPSAQGAQEGADVQQEAEAIVSKLYSGDRKQAAEAIAAIIARSGRTEVLDPKKVAAEAAALMQQQLPSRAVVAQEEPDTQAAEIDAVNQMMKAEYADILADSGLRKLARERFDEMLRMADHVGRSMVDVARDAADEIREKYARRAEVIERKRALPVQPSGGSAAPTEPAYKPRTPSEIVAEMRKHRGMR